MPAPLAVREGRPLYGGDLRLHDGPERMESGWWEAGDIRRDYYVASNVLGQRLWIFRELRQPRGWYLHGSSLSLRYRPNGHADPFLKNLLDISSRGAMNEPELTPTQSTLISAMSARRRPTPC